MKQGGVANAGLYSLTVSFILYTQVIPVCNPVSDCKAFNNVLLLQFVLYDKINS